MISLGSRRRTRLKEGDDQDEGGEGGGDLAANKRRWRNAGAVDRSDATIGKVLKNILKISL